MKIRSNEVTREKQKEIQIRDEVEKYFDVGFYKTAPHKIIGYLGKIRRTSLVPENTFSCFQNDRNSALEDCALFNIS